MSDLYRPRLGRTTAAYVAALLVIAGMLALTSFLAVEPAMPSVRLLVAFVAINALSQAAELSQPTGATNTAYTPVEVGIGAAIVALPMPWPALTATAGTLVYELTVGVARRRPLTRSAYNVASTLTAATLATFVARATPAVGPTLADGPGVVNALLGVMTYIVIDTLLFALLLRTRDATGNLVTGFVRLARYHFLGAMTFGGVGIVAWHLWLTEPLLLLVLPLLLMTVLSYVAASNQSDRLVDAVKANRDELARLVSSTSEGIVRTNVDGGVLLWNPAMERLTGIAAGHALGRNLDDLLHSVGAAARPRPGRSRREPSDLTIRTRGAETVLRERRAPVRSGEGQTLGEVAVYADVTQDRRLEAMKDDFIARISHELRTPLTPIVGMAAHLRRAGPRDASDALLLERIEQNGHRLTQLIDELLLVANLDVPTTVRVTPVDGTGLRELIESEVTKVSTQNPDRTIEVTMPVPTPTVEIDVQRFATVLERLLENAIQYTPAASPVEVVVRHEAALTVAVVDHGPGIPESEREQVFNRFHRLEDALRQTSGGIGLGLYVARRLAEMMGARLWCEETEGGGTTFLLALRAPDERTAVPSDADAAG